ncbi:Mor transcription activator family protein [Levilactobacillus sp. HBUAS70063]|uniref:Mor transcription activator family protein n=1 Tax=Levilactobacillus sp. HBUAS70063 TaxID=3109359 RepID=UPI00313354DB
MAESQRWQQIYQELAEIIGEQNTKKVFTEFRGSTVNFPLRLVRREVLQQQVRADFSAGLKIHQLSIKYDLAERTVRKYLNR